MSRDAKIGLLSGLVFIMIFAMILADRGQPDRLVTQFPHALLQEVMTKKPVVASATPSAEEQVGPSMVTQKLAYWWGGKDGQEMPNRSDMLLANSPAFASVGGQQPVEVPTPVRDARSATPPDPEQQPTQDQLVSAKPVPGASKQAPAARYKVRKGDTLWKIVETHYGKPSMDLLDAVCKANAGVINAKDDIRVDMELVLPVMGERGVTSTLIAANQPTTETKAPTAKTSKQDADFRWYQVKPNEGYRTIARQELGDASRWSELYDMNKKLFPDADKVRHGVRIKIPTQLASATSPAESKQDGAGKKSASHKKAGTKKGKQGQSHLLSNAKSPKNSDSQRGSDQSVAVR